MSHLTMISGRAVLRILSGAVVATSAFVASTTQAAVPGITGGATTAPIFNLTASADYNSQPDGASIYSWGYGCTRTPAGFLPAAVIGSAGPAATCPLMQRPGPTMIVTQGDKVTVTLTNGLPRAAGNTSIVFPGFQVCAATLNSDGTCTGTPTGVPGLLAQEATKGNTVTYTFTAPNPGTYSYHSGTQPDLQIEMGLSGAIVVLPAAATIGCTKGRYSNASSAYNHPETCYDREYLFQFSEMSSMIHDQVKAQIDACSDSQATACPPIVTTMEPYHPNYFLINGRSMPDLMDTSYSASYVHQPYNGNPHMHPGERVLMRVVGQGRWQHPFHFHGNHARVLARDAGLLTVQNDTQTPARLAGPLLFTIATVSGQTVDAIFTWTGQGLNWDVYGLQNTIPVAGAAPVVHTCKGKNAVDVNGRNKFTSPSSSYDPTSSGFDGSTHEYCLDHGKPIPATPPDPSIVVNGQWYGGTPYIGLQAANPTPEAPGTLNQNPQAGYAYMWHSHNEREITTNDVFPGGMMMMLLIDPFTWFIDETL